MDAALGLSKKKKKKGRNRYTAKANRVEKEPSKGLYRTDRRK